jgi:Protein of unknown function (DUF3102)
MEEALSSADGAALQVPPAGTAAAVLTDHANEIRRLGKRAAADVIEIGRRLTVCKKEKLVAHGQWSKWLEKEFGWSDETALRFMRVYDLTTQENFNYHKLRDLGLPVSALYLIAAPSTPDEARDEISARAEAGEKMSVSEVKDTIAGAKGRKQAPKPEADEAPAPGPTTGTATTSVVNGNDVPADASSETMKTKLAAFDTDKESEPEITPPTTATPGASPRRRRRRRWTRRRRSKRSRG